MKVISILLGFVLIGLLACSSGKKKEPQPESLSADVEKSLEEPEGEQIFTEVEMEEESPQLTEMVEEEQMVVSEGPKREILSKVTITELGNYKVKRGDTLLYIAFKIYGDYRKWRSLLQTNPGLNPKDISAGDVLKFEIPEVAFNWNRQGLAHLIQRGETLGKISMLHYGTSQRWKEIHENNRDMILDPNLIFAGFTLYYVPDQVARAD